MASQASLTLVQQLYVAYYGRPADPLGLTFWANKVDQAGGNAAAAQATINAFGTSAEATAIYGSSSLAAQINNVYQNILGRAADVTGLNYYANQIATGALTLAGLANAVLQGATTGTDATIVANKTLEANAFTNALTTTAQIVAYSGTTAAATAQAWLATVGATAASVTAANGTLNATINTIVSAPAPATAYTLTTGVDNIVAPTNTNIAVSGILDGKTTANNTLNAADVISGNASGSNSLSLTIASSDGTTAVADATSGAQITNIQTVNLRNTNATGAGGVSLDASKISGLTTVNVNQGVGDVTVTNLANGGSFGLVGNGSVKLGVLALGSAAAATSQTVNVSGGVNGTGAVTLTGTGATALTINSNGTAANTIGALTMAATETSLTVNASANLTVGGITGAGLATVTVSGSAGLVTLGALPATAVTVNASGLTSGGVNLKLAAAGATKSFVGGANNNFVTTNGALTNATALINAGTGTGNTLDVAASADINSTTLGAQYKGFNTLQVEAGVSQDINNLSATNTITAAVVNGVGGAATAINNLASGVGVTVQNSANTAGAANTIDFQTAGSLTLGIKGATNPGQIDTLNIAVNDGATAASTVKLGAITLAGIENVVITNSNANDTTTISSAANMLQTSSLKFSGAGSASFTSGAVALPSNMSIDMSGMAKTTTIDISANTGTSGSSLKGGVGAATITLDSNYDIVDVSANTAGGSSITQNKAKVGVLTVTLGTHTATDTITLGEASLNGLGGAAAASATTVSGFNTGATGDVLKFSLASFTTGVGAAGNLIKSGGAAGASANVAAADAISLATDTSLSAAYTMAAGTNVLVINDGANHTAAQIKTALNGAGVVTFANANTTAGYQILTEYQGSDGVHFAVVTPGAALNTAAATVTDIVVLTGVQLSSMNAANLGAFVA